MSKRTKSHTRRQPQALAPIVAKSQADTGNSGAFLLWGSDYQAAGQSPNRGYIMWSTTDTRRQMTSFTRTEILRRVQWLYAHFGFCRRLVNGMARLLGYVVPQPNTSDEEWNELAYDAIQNTLGNAVVWDIQGKFDGITGQVQDNVSIFRDGFTLAVMTETTNGQPRLAYYEAHQIKNGPGCTGTGWVDGVLLSRSGAHIAYCVQDGEDKTQFTIVDAKDAVYFGNFENRGQVHAISILVPAVLNMIDVVDTRGAIKAAINEHARKGIVIEQDLPNAQHGVGGAGVYPQQTVTATLPDGTQQQLTFEVATNGTKNQTLAPGQHVKVIADDRPSQNFREFERAVLTDCCHACDLDYESIADISRVTGPGIRYLNAALKRWTLLRRKPQVTRVHRLTVWALAKQMKSGRLRQPILKPGEQWWNRLEYIGLAAMDIDGGRTAAATLTDLRSGQTNYLTEHGQRGVFWKRAIKQTINEVQFIEAECLRAEEESGLPPGRLSPERIFPDRFEPQLAPLIPAADPSAANIEVDTEDTTDAAAA